MVNILMKNDGWKPAGKTDAFRVAEGVLWTLLVLVTMAVCVSVGSVSIPLI